MGASPSCSCRKLACSFAGGSGQHRHGRCRRRPRGQGVTELTCCGTSYQMVITGNGLWTPAHGSASNTMFIQRDSADSGTVRSAEGNIVNEFRRRAMPQGARARRTGGDIVDCTFSFTEVSDGSTRSSPRASPSAVRARSRPGTRRSLRPGTERLRDGPRPQYVPAVQHCRSRALWGRRVCTGHRLPTVAAQSLAVARHDRSVLSPSTTVERSLGADRVLPAKRTAAVLLVSADLTGIVPGSDLARGRWAWGCHRRATPSRRTRPGRGGQCGGRRPRRVPAGRLGRRRARPR